MIIYVDIQIYDLIYVYKYTDVWCIYNGNITGISPPM